MKNNILKLASKIKMNAISEFLILAMIFLVPLYFNYFSASSIDFSKIVIFKIILLLLVSSSVCSLASERVGINKERWVDIIVPIGLFFLSLLTSLAFSTNFNSSWFGSYDRNEGVSSFLLYGVWLILLLFNLNDIFDNKARLKRIFLAIIASSALVSIYAIAQLFGLDFFSWSEPAHLTKRAFSSFGQPNYLACWLLLTIPVSVYMVYESRRLSVKAIYLFLSLLQIATLFVTGSRSAFLSFFLAASFLFLPFFLFKKKLRKKSVGIISLSFISLAVLFVLGLQTLNPSRLQDFRDIKRGSVAARLQLWDKGSEAFLKKPLFGYGLENQKEAYVQYYEPDWAIYSRPNTYSDRAHNLILDILLTAGLFGLASFTYLVYRVFSSLWRAYIKERNYVLIFIIWSLFSYLISLLFNFSVTVTHVYFFLFISLAFLAGGPVFKKSARTLKNPLPYLIVSGVLVFMFYGLATQVRAMEADYYFNKALMAINNKQYFTAMVLNDYMLQSKPNPVASFYYGRNISLRLIEDLPAITDRSSRYIVMNYLDSFAASTKDNAFENLFVKAFAVGVTEGAAAAEEIFQELSLKSPYLPKIYLAWGDVSLSSGNAPKAKLKFEKAKSLLPALDNPYLNEDHLRQLQYYYKAIDDRLALAAMMINK